MNMESMIRQLWPNENFGTWKPVAGKEIFPQVKIESQKWQLVVINVKEAVINLKYWEILAVLFLVTFLSILQ